MSNPNASTVLKGWKKSQNLQTVWAQSCFWRDVRHYWLKKSLPPLWNRRSNWEQTLCHCVCYYIFKASKSTLDNYLHHNGCSERLKSYGIDLKSFIIKNSRIVPACIAYMRWSYFFATLLLSILGLRAREITQIESCRISEASSLFKRRSGELFVIVYEGRTVLQKLNWSACSSNSQHTYSQVMKYQNLLSHN